MSSTEKSSAPHAHPSTEDQDHNDTVEVHYKLGHKPRYTGVPRGWRRSA
jgi:hypothetical protein